MATRSASKRTKAVRQESWVRDNPSLIRLARIPSFAAAIVALAEADLEDLRANGQDLAVHRAIAKRIHRRANKGDLQFLSRRATFMPSEHPDLLVEGFYDA